MEEIRIPPGNRALSIQMTERLIKATWFARVASPPDKFVVLLDVDSAKPEDVLGPFRQQLPRRLEGIDASIQFAFAQWHLEAWYFADAENLREHLGRNLGSLDVTRPDEMHNPKLHLKHLLGERVYTARVSEDIARALNASTIVQRCPSFKGFLDEVVNGPPAPKRLTISVAPCAIGVTVRYAVAPGAARVRSCGEGTSAARSDNSHFSTYGPLPFAQPIKPTANFGRVRRSS